MNRSEIKEWLKTEKRDRHWLAEKCGVSKATVDGWLSSRTIPGPAAAVIQGLMNRDQSIAPMFSLDEFRKIEQAARREGKTVDEWVAEMVRKEL